MHRPALARALASLVAVALCAACAHLPAPPAARGAGYRYVDARRGVAFELPAGWNGFERAEDLPPELRELMTRGPDARASFVGADAHGLAFASLWLFPARSALTTLDFFRGYWQRAGSGAETDNLEAAYSRERDSVRWCHRTRGPFEMTFVDTLAVRRGYAVLLTVATPSPLASASAAQLDSIAGELLLYDGTGWSAPWRDLDATLDARFFPDVQLAERPDPDLAPHCAGTPRGFLWKVASEHGAMFLFPSLHVGHPSLFPLPAPVEEAFADSDRLVVEVDVRREASKPQLAGVPASAALTPEQRGRVEAKLAAFGLPIAAFEHLPPWLAAVSLELLEWQSLGYFAQFGVDGYFLERAGAREVVELESAAAQTALLAELGAPLLDQTLAAIDRLPGVAHPMFEAWYCGDEPALTHLSEEPGSGLPADLRRPIYDARNEAMADRLESLLERPGVTFVTVGLGHFEGPAGLPALLAKRGHEVTRQ